MAGNDRRAVEYVGNTLTFRASAIGYCRKVLIAEKMGLGKKSPGERMQAAFDAGHRYEQEIVKAVADDLGFEYKPNYDQYLTFHQYEDMVITGHIDAMFDAEFWEVKLLAKADYEKWKKNGVEQLKKHRIYAWQNSAYMHSLAFDYGRIIPCRFIVGEKVDGEWTGNYTQFMVERPIVTLGEIEAQMCDVRDAEELGVCDNPQWPCPFEYLHTDEDEGKSEYKEIEEVEDRIRLKEALYELSKAKEMSAKAEELKKSAYEIIKGLTDINGKKMSIDKVKVAWVTMRRMGYDFDKMPEELKQQMDEYKTKETVSEYAKVMEPKKSK